MPATIMHAIFASDVYNLLDNKIKDKLDLSRLKMFSESTDSLLFYNLFNFKCGKDIRKLQNTFHRKGSQSFFIKTINYIKDNKYINNTDVLSYLVGFICHYVLDTTVHPYVFYKTGKFDKNKPSTYKYNNAHAFMETFLDNYIVMKRMKTNPYKFDLANYCFDDREFSEELKEVIDYGFESTYRVKNMSSIYYISLQQMKKALTCFRRDVTGIKKWGYKLIDTFTSKRVFRFEAVSYHYPLKDYHNFLNTNHTIWHNPADYTIASEESFDELYERSVKVAKMLIEASFSYLSGLKDIELTSYFTDKSYVTGLDNTVSQELKYFEF